MSFVVIGFAIAILVKNAGYRKRPTMGERKSLRVLSIFMIISLCFLLLNIIVVAAVAAFAGSDSMPDYVRSFLKAINISAFYDIFNANDRFTDSVSGTLDTMTDFASAFLWVLAAIAIVVFVFGFICMIVGFSTAANRELTAVADSNTKNYIGNLPAKYCPVCKSKIFANAVTCPNCKTVLEPQQPTVSFTTAPAGNNAAQQAAAPVVPPVTAQAQQQPGANALQHDWFCPDCGTKNNGSIKFCPNCGRKNPNLS